VGLFAGIILLGCALVATVRDRRAADWPSAPGTLGWAAPSWHVGAVVTIGIGRAILTSRADAPG
jgi:hypothetical protein